MAAAVERDVDRVSEWSHLIALPDARRASTGPYSDDCRRHFSSVPRLHPGHRTRSVRALWTCPRTPGTGVTYQYFWDWRAHPLAALAHKSTKTNVDFDLD